MHVDRLIMKLFRDYYVVTNIALVYYTNAATYIGVGLISLFLYFDNYVTTH